MVIVLLVALNKDLRPNPLPSVKMPVTSFSLTVVLL